MHITLFAAGSQGDVQPCIRLGRGLRQAGFAVLLAAPENFAGLVQDHGLDFHPLRGDVQQIMASETGRRFMEAGSANPFASIPAVRRMLGPVAMEMAEDALEACREADLLISLAVFATFSKTIAEVRQIRLIHVEPTPMLPTAAFPAPGWPVQKNLGRLHNWLSGFAMLQVIWQWYRPFVNDFRQRHGLPPYASGSFYRALNSTPLLGAYSPRVIPHPPDWPDGAHITGYWFPDAATQWRPPPALEAFLEAGDPPVYVGFGSMAGRDPAQLATTILRALARSGQRGLLLTGWGGMQAMSVPKDIFVVLDKIGRVIKMKQGDTLLERFDRDPEGRPLRFKEAFLMDKRVEINYRSIIVNPDGSTNLGEPTKVVMPIVPPIGAVALFARARVASYFGARRSK